MGWVEQGEAARRNSGTSELLVKCVLARKDADVRTRELESRRARTESGSSRQCPAGGWQSWTSLVLQGVSPNKLHKQNVLPWD